MSVGDDEVLAAIERLIDAVEDWAAYDWPMFGAAAVTGAATVIAVISALRTSRKAERTASDSKGIAEKSALAASESAAAAQALVKLEEQRLGEEYRESLRGPVVELNAALRRLRGAINQESRPAEGQSPYWFWATCSAEARVAAESLWLTARGDDVVVPLAMIGALNHAKEHDIDDRVIEHLDTCIDSLQMWFQHGEPDKWAMRVHDAAQALQELDSDDPAGPVFTAI